MGVQAYPRTRCRDSWTDLSRPDNRACGTVFKRPLWGNSQVDDGRPHGSRLRFAAHLTMRAPESSLLFPTLTPTHQPRPALTLRCRAAASKGEGASTSPATKLSPPPKTSGTIAPVPAQAARSRRTVGAGMPGEVEVAPSPAVTDDLARPHPGHRAHRALVGAGPSRGRSFTTESLGNMGRGEFHLYPATPDDRHRDESRPMTQQQPQGFRPGRRFGTPGDSLAWLSRGCRSRPRW